jgi:hypothetical protein
MTAEVELPASGLRIPHTPEEMADLLAHMSEHELRELYEADRMLAAQLRLTGPQNDDELHAWIKQEMGLDIPRVKVCPDHDPPFQFLADLYFERVDAALGVANRGGAKTFMVALLHWLNSRFKPGCESCTFGAVEQQSFRAYAHLKNWIYDEDGDKIPEVISSLMSKTEFRNGSSIEVLGSTPEQVNGPHPQKAHADEIELMRSDTWKESRNMTISGVTKDGRKIKPQDIATSTRKGPSGRVQQLIDEITKAVNDGYDPPRALYMWCQKETAKEIPNCQMVEPEVREARMKELEEEIGLDGLEREYGITDPCSICDCHKKRKGENEDGTPRLLTQICKGDFFRSRGWQPPEDVNKQFKENDPETYEAQILCAKPEMKWHYLPTFTEEKWGVRDYLADPANGPIFTSVDWGGTNPHAVLWLQLLRYEIEVTGFDGRPKRLKEGALVVFDEIYKAEIGNDKLGNMVKEKEQDYRLDFGAAFKIYERYSDPQGKAARLDWKAMGLRTSWHATREFEEHIKAIRSFATDGLIAVATDKCPMWVREAKAWRRDPSTGKELEENFNHAMSAFRYAVTNIRRISKKALMQGDGLPNAKSYQRRAPGPTIRDGRKPRGPVGFSGKEDSYDKWRRSLGAPISEADRV